MAVRINFIDGTNVVIEVALDQVEHAYKKALLNGGPLRIDTEAGSIVVNPEQIVYMETPGIANGNGSNDDDVLNGATSTVFVPRA